MANLKDLNNLRQKGFKKNQSQEDFLLKVNQELNILETENYKDNITEKPILFVFGTPRSGTTLTTQVISSGLDLGFINNFSARFWISPVTGIKLSKIIHGEKFESDLSSNYATTKNIKDIHEFGYFWRKWLNIESVDDILNITDREKNIDWTSLKNTVLNIQDEFDKSLILKNIFGAYHLKKFIELFPKSLWIYIERDPIDNIISIIEARKKFYSDPNIWWSTAPLEYHQIKNLNYVGQVCHQVYYLRKFYKEQIEQVNPQNILTINYQDICKNPRGFIKKIQEKVKLEFNHDISLRNEIPVELNYRQYSSYPDMDEIKNEYNRLITNE